MIEIAARANTVKRTLTHAATGLATGLRQYSYSVAMLGLVQSLDDETFLGEGGN